MKYSVEAFTAKDGKVYTLRSPEKADAEKMLAYLKTCAGETDYNLSYPEELSFTVADEEVFIETYGADPGCLMITAFLGDELVGNASLCCVMEREKTRHRATFGMAILREHWGRGLGRKILTELIDCAKSAGYQQLELEVASENVRAVQLYESLGFVTYGERPCSLKRRNGSFYEEKLMILTLSSQ